MQVNLYNHHSCVISNEKDKWCKKKAKKNYKKKIGKIYGDFIIIWGYFKPFTNIKQIKKKQTFNKMMTICLKFLHRLKRLFKSTRLVNMIKP